jgi:uncharacterized protein (TIGR03435 family)
MLYKPTLRRGFWVLGVWALLTGVGSLAAQAPQSPRTPPFPIAPEQRRFEEISIRRHESCGPFNGPHVAPGRFTVGSATPRALIVNYSGFSFDRINLPSWTSSECYDITAITGEPVPSLDEMFKVIPGMVRAMLTDRFGLVARVSQRETTIYTLQLSRADKKLGSQIRPSSFDCDTFFRNTAAVLASGGDTPCSLNSRGIAGSLIGRDVTLASLASRLTGILKQEVRDETGLSGRFSFELAWAPDSLELTDRPSLFTAVQEQLGLKLQPGKGQVEVLVIDEIERPTDN